MSSTLITSRDPKGRQATSIFEAAYNDAKLDDDKAQLLNERGGELKSGILNLISELLVSNQYADEEVRSTYGYPRKYKVKPLAQQIDELRKRFPELSLEATQEFIEKVLPTLKLPERAEGWFAIPRWEKLAATYKEAVELVLCKIAETRKFTNYREGQLGPDRLRQHARSIEMWARLGEQQKDHETLVVPAQFGFMHRGRSVRRAREVFMASEFGLGTFANGIMLLTHPERRVSYDDLWIDCAGDEYDYPGDDVRFGSAPYFLFDDGWVEFGAGWVDRASVHYGAASGWFPQ